MNESHPFITRLPTSTNRTEKQYFHFSQTFIFFSLANLRVWIGTEKCDRLFSLLLFLFFSLLYSPLIQAHTHHRVCVGHGSALSELFSSLSAFGKESTQSFYLHNSAKKRKEKKKRKKTAWRRISSIHVPLRVLVCMYTVQSVLHIYIYIYFYIYIYIKYIARGSISSLSGLIFSFQDPMYQSLIFFRGSKPRTQKIKEKKKVNRQ